MRRLVATALVALALGSCAAQPAWAGKAEARRNKHTFHVLYPHTGAQQWNCVNKMWQRESGWHHRAQNGSMYGIPQIDLSYAPSKKWIARYKRSPEVQLRAGHNYVHNRYGTYCRAYQHLLDYGWE